MSSFCFSKPFLFLCFIISLHISAVFLRSDWLITYCARFVLVVIFFWITHHLSHMNLAISSLSFIYYWKIMPFSSVFFVLKSIYFSFKIQMDVTFWFVHLFFDRTCTHGQDTGKLIDVLCLLQLLARRKIGLFIFFFSH